MGMEKYAYVHDNVYTSCDTYVNPLELSNVYISHVN